jgi:hypothetical protein
LLNHLTLPVMRIVSSSWLAGGTATRFLNEKKAAHAAFLGPEKAGPQRDDTGTRF